MVERTKYQAIPERYWVDEDGDVWPDGPVTMQVVEDGDHEPRATGLLDKRGVPLYALPRRRRIGF